MDPFTAYATAQAAVAGIKGAIAMGKDIKNIMSDIGKLLTQSQMQSLIVLFDSCNRRFSHSSICAEV